MGVRARVVPPRPRALAAGSVLLLVAACGDDGGALTRDEFLERADAICAEGQARIDAAADELFERADELPSDEEIERLLRDVTIPELRDQLDALRDLEPPDELADDVDAVLDALEDGLERIEATADDPRQLLADDPLGEASALARELGLTECGSGDGEDEGG